jgi:hypothetical protein
MTNRRPLSLGITRLSLILLAASMPARAFPEGAPQPPPATGVMTAAEEDRIISSLPVVPPGLNTGYALKLLPSKTVSASYMASDKCPDFAISEWEAFAPLPPDLPGQTISNLRTEPATEIVEDLTPLHRKLLRAQVHSAAAGSVHELKFNISFDACLQRRTLVWRGPSAAEGEPAALTEAERKLALRPSVQLDYTNASFTAWLDKNHLRRAGQEGEVDFAIRVCKTIGKSIRYDVWLGNTSERASFVCMISGATCGGLSNVFVAALRSQGIPARTLEGRLARAAGSLDFFNGVPLHLEHAMAEFFAQGVGWVPVEVTAAQQGMYGFGNHSPIFIALHVDPDVTLATANYGQQHFRSLVGATWWFHGGSGTSNGRLVKREWTFK